MRHLTIGDYTIRITVRELVFPLLVLGFCAGYYIDTRSLTRQSMLYAEPVLVITAVLATAVITMSAVRVESNDVANNRDHVSMVGFSNSKDLYTHRTIYLVTLTAAYLLIMRVAFIPVTGAFLAATLYVLGERRLWVLAVYATGLTALVSGVFILWLNVPL